MPAPPEAITGTATACATARRERQVVAVARAVAVHARQQDLPGAALDAPRGTTRSRRARRRAAAGDVDLPAARRVAGVARLRVDREHDALRAEPRAQLVDQLRPRERRRVDADLVGARVEHRLRVRDRADPAADRERDEDVVRGAPRELDDGVATLVGRGDVEEDELVGALGVVALGQLDRIARVADVDEVRALDDAAGVDVQARDDALHVHASRVGVQTFSAG